MEKYFPPDTIINSVTWCEENASGFLVSVQDEWYLLTAGHVLDRLNKIQEEGCVISNWALDDTAGKSVDPKLPIPFDFPNAAKHYINIEGINDYAIIHIPNYYRNLMSSNNRLPLSEKTWRLPESDNYDAYWMIGVPEELITRPNGSSIQGKQDVLLKVEKVTEEVEDSNLDGAAFRGKIVPMLGSEEAPLNDIAGMSGCPIFGLNFDASGAINYWVIALQSSWLQKQQSITAYPIQRFAEEVDDLVASGKLNINAS